MLDCRGKASVNHHHFAAALQILTTELISSGGCALSVPLPPGIANSCGCYAEGHCMRFILKLLARALSRTTQACCSQVVEHQSFYLFSWQKSFSGLVFRAPWNGCKQQLGFQSQAFLIPLKGWGRRVYVSHCPGPRALFVDTSVSLQWAICQEESCGLHPSQQLRISHWKHFRLQSQLKTLAWHACCGLLPFLNSLVHLPH